MWLGAKGASREKSTAKCGIGAKAHTNVHVSDDTTLVLSKMLHKLHQVCVIVKKFNDPPLGKLDELSFTVDKENILAATMLIAEVKMTIDDLTKKVATDALAKVELEAQAICCIPIFQIGKYELAAQECMDVLVIPLIDEALAMIIHKCLCWSSFGNGGGSSHAYMIVWNALNDNESVLDLCAMNTVNNLSKEVSKAVNDLNWCGHLAPTKVALKKVLKTVNEFLDMLPGLMIMQVNKVHFLSQLGSWSELRAYVEDVADKTLNQVSIFIGDLESKGLFPAPGQLLSMTMNSL